MRDSLKELIKNTILFKYKLPCTKHGIEKICFSTEHDDCYECTDMNSIVSIIYNSIIEYSYETFPNDLNKLQNMHTAALKNKLKYHMEKIYNMDFLVKFYYVAFY